MGGESTAETAKLLYGGFEPMQMARLQRAMYEPNPAQRSAFSALGLRPEALAERPLGETLGQLSMAFERITSPTQRAALAMDLFGRAGAEVLPALKEFRRKLEEMPDWRKMTPRGAIESRNAGRAWEAGNLGFQEGVSGLGRTWELFGGAMRWASKGGPLTAGGREESGRIDKMLARWTTEDVDAQFAQQREDQRLRKERDDRRMEADECRRNRLSGVYDKGDIEARMRHGDRLAARHLQTVDARPLRLR